MESRQFYICVSEGVYNSWRAVGVLEDLHSDGDIGHFLVTLYSSQKQGDGGGSSIRCVHCHRHLSLYCTACHRPSHLALPLPLPPHHHPPPSLTSPPPPHPLPVSPLSSPHTLDTSVPLSGDAEGLNTPVLNSEKPDASLEEEKTEADLSEDEGGFDFDDCPVDFGTVKPVSPFSVVEDDLRKSETLGADDLETHTAVERRHRRSSLTKPVVGSRKERRKKRVASTVVAKSRQRKVMKKSQCLTNNSVTDYCCRGGSKKTQQNNHPQTKDSVCPASSKEGDLQEKVRDVKSDVPEENLFQEEKKAAVFESAHLGDGVIIPTEERLSAEIHMFDNSFFKQHRAESKPLNCVKHITSSSANNPQTGFTAEDMRQNQELLEEKTGEDGVPHLKMESSSEALSINDMGKPSLKILVSGQKIPPIKTADGSYIRSLYSYFECLFCRKAFIHKRSFNKHVQTHVEENLFKCTVCKKGFESLYTLTEHEKKHKFECEVCGKKCTEKTDYNNHMKLHTENDGVMKCPGCSYQSTDFYVFRKHKYECAYLRPALQCEICGVHLKSVKSLKHHIAAIHKNDRPYKCSLCDKSFVFKTKLNCHMKYNHAEGGRLFHCDKCGNRFIDPKGLKSHQKSVHSNEKPFKCSYCPSAFARKYTLGVHMRLHTGEKPFRCTECLQAFVQKPSLLLHLKSHHGQQAKVGKMQQAETENVL